MIITFKSFDDLKTLASDVSKTEELPTKNKKFNDTINSICTPAGLDSDIEILLKNIAEKEFEVSDFRIVGKNDIEFSIDTNSIEGNQLNTNVLPNHFSFTKDWCDSIDYQDITLWYCRNCGHTIKPDVQKVEFEPELTYLEKGIENAVCPLCFTKTLDKFEG